MKSRFVFFFLLAFLLPAVSFAGTAIGKVDRAQGPCHGTVAGTTQELVAGGSVFLDQPIATGADARLTLTFDDGTTLTLGENASLTLDQFVFQPAGANQLHAAVVGAFRYVSGRLAPGATREASVTTPVATIGVRGTDFWGGPIDGAFGVVVLEGAVTVTANGSAVAVNAAGQGVNIGAGAAPGAVTNWSQAKIDRAIATVTFR